MWVISGTIEPIIKILSLIRSYVKFSFVIMKSAKKAPLGRHIKVRNWFKPCNWWLYFFKRQIFLDFNLIAAQPAAAFTVSNSDEPAKTESIDKAPAKSDTATEEAAPPAHPSSASKVKETRTSTRGGNLARRSVNYLRHLYTYNSIYLIISSVACTSLLNIIKAKVGENGSDGCLLIKKY